MLEAVRLVKAIPVEGPQLCGLTFFNGFLWYSDGILERIFGIDPRAGNVVRTFPCPGVRTGLTNAGGRLLQVAGPDRALRSIAASTGLADMEWPNPRPGHELCGIEAKGDRIWLGYKKPSLLELRTWPGLELVKSIETPHDVAGVTMVGDLLVFADHPGGEIVVIDPAGERVLDTMPVAGHPTGLTWDGERLWYCDYDNERLCAVELPAHVLGA